MLDERVQRYLTCMKLDMASSRYAVIRDGQGGTGFDIDVAHSRGPRPHCLAGLREISPWRLS